jgi:hypothetical protein
MPQRESGEPNRQAHGGVCEALFHWSHSSAAAQLAALLLHARSHGCHVCAF